MYVFDDEVLVAAAGFSAFVSAAAFVVAGSAVLGFADSAGLGFAGSAAALGLAGSAALGLAGSAAAFGFACSVGFLGFTGSALTSAVRLQATVNNTKLAHKAAGHIPDLLRRETCIKRSFGEQPAKSILRHALLLHVSAEQTKNSPRSGGVLL